MGAMPPPAESVNFRYVARLARKDWLKNLQTAYFKHRVSLKHARTKSHFVRYFGVASRNVHFVEQLARTLLPAEFIDRAEAELLERIDTAMREVDKETERAHTLLAAEGITALPEYVQAPLELEAKCTSPKMTRYLELIIKADRLLTVLEALRLAGAIGTNAYDRQVAIAVRRLVSVPRSALHVAVALRKRARGGAATPPVQAALPLPSVPAAAESEVEQETDPALGGDTEGAPVEATAPAVQTDIALSHGTERSNVQDFGAAATNFAAPAPAPARSTSLVAATPGSGLVPE